MRTAATRQHDVARELRRRVQARFEQEQIALAAVHRVELVGAASPSAGGRESSQ